MSFRAARYTVCYAWALAFAVAAMQSGCAPAVRGPAAPEGSHGPAVPGASRDAVAYDVASERSQVHILVYRSGPLARLGHNHVLISKSIAGSVWIAEPFERSSFELVLPVEDIIVDDPAARREEGGAFLAEVPAAAREATHRNMLKPEVLDGAQYPAITVRAVGVAGRPEAPSFNAAITIKQTTREIRLAATVHYENATLVASGEFDINQTDFGITPFSIGLGALQVQDQLHVKFKLVATRR